MQKQDLSGWQCSIARTADLIGDWWTPLILRDSAAGIATFDAFQASLGISRNTLTQRLNRLVEAGMMAKRAYSDRPPRYEYQLTEMGREFVPVLLAMTAWGDKWLFDGQAPYKVRHTTCGQDAVAVVVCDCCAEPLTYETTETRAALRADCRGSRTGSP